MLAFLPTGSPSPRPMAYHSHQMKSSRNVSKSTTRLGGEDVPALQHRCMRHLLNRNGEMLPEWLLWHWRPTRIWVLCKKLKETFWWKEKEHYGALRNEPKMSPLSLTGLLGQVNASKSQSWKTKEHVWKHFIKSSSQNMEGNTADHWAEVIDIGTHASEEELNLGTSFHNVMKTTTNSAISESCRRM